MSKTMLSVEGMSSRVCVEHVIETLSIRGVGSVDVQLDERDAQARLGVNIRWGEDGKTRAAVDELLASSLDLDAAVRIALVRNRHLQAFRRARNRCQRDRGRDRIVAARGRDRLQASALEHERGN